MAINETTVTGRKFRKLIDEATKQWQKISFWTSASDVEFEDGQTAEEKLCNTNEKINAIESKLGSLAGINGISDVFSDSKDIALNVAAGKFLYNEIIKIGIKHVQLDETTLTITLREEGEMI